MKTGCLIRLVRLLVQLKLGSPGVSKQALPGPATRGRHPRFVNRTQEIHQAFALLSAT